MIKITELGKKYLLTDTEDDGLVYDLQIILLSDLDIALPHNTQNLTLSEMSSYINAIKSKISTPFLSPYDIYWHCTTSEKYLIWDVVRACVDNNYSTAIVEFINDKNY